MHVGAIVEDAFVIAHGVHTEITMIGRMSATGRTKVQIWASELASDREQVVQEMIWTSESGKESIFAGAFASRALFYLNFGEYEKALRDANKALERDSDLTLAYTLRSQICSSSPIDRLRDSEQALADATKYCELKKNDPIDRWVCHSLMAAAFAEKGRYSDAITEARSAIEKAPEEMQGVLCSDLQNYLLAVPRRMPTKEQLFSATDPQ